MRTYRYLLWILPIAIAVGLLTRVRAQSSSIPERIWRDSGEQSQLESLGQVLTDSIGARMSGSNPDLAAHDWVRRLYEKRGFTVHTEAYDTLPRQWNRGFMHVDLIAPRQRTLEAMSIGYSPGTNGDVEGPVVAIPNNLTTPGAFKSWLGSVRGKFVLITFGRPTCREKKEWDMYASPVSRARLEPQWEKDFSAWKTSIKQAGVPYVEVPRVLEEAGAIGVLGTSPSFLGYDRNSYAADWDGHVPGTIHDGMYSTVSRIPLINLGCEDLGLLTRLANRGQGPRLRVNSTASFGAPAPILHTVAELRGTEKPDEYVVIGEHMDSMDGASGATDNGTGTLAAIEAMRLLKQYYPKPRRTIVVNHWSGEEQLLSWNHLFARDAASVSPKIQVSLTQDTGTGRTVFVTLTGPSPLASAWSRWAAQFPREVLDTVVVRPMQPIKYASTAFPGSAACAGVPTVWINAYNFEKRWNFESKSYPPERWRYDYGYHGNRDTYDLIVFDEVEHNAKLLAMMAYAAAQDTTFIPAQAESNAPELKPCNTHTPRVPSKRHPNADPIADYR